MRSDALLVPKTDTLLSEAVDDFMLHQKACRNSDKTQSSYKETLTKMVDWLTGEGHTTIEAVTPAILRKWLAELTEKETPRGTKLRPATVWTYYKNARVFFNFLESEEMIGVNPIKKVKAPKLDKELLPAFTAAEIQSLESATSGKDAASLRNRALIYFLLDTGCRLSETANMRVQDIDTSTGIVRVWKGKGGKDRVTKLGVVALRAMNRYLRVRRSIKSDALWVGAYGALTAPGIRVILERLGKDCGVHCHAHKFRRTTALTMLRNGCDVYSIKNLLGHADLQIMQRYLNQTESDITRAHTLYSPLDNLESSSPSRKRTG